MDNFHINLQMDNSEECLSRLKVAFSSCIMPTQTFLDPALNIIQLTCTIPPWSLTQSGDKTIDLYVIVASDQPNQVLDAWPVGYFTYQSKKRSSNELSLDCNTMMMKRIKPPSLSTVDKVTDQEAQARQLATSDYIIQSQSNFNYNYYGLHSQYMEPTANSSTDRSKLYNDESTSPSPFMFPHKRTTAPGSFNSTIGLSPGNLDQMTTSGESPHDFTDPTSSFDLSTSSIQHRTVLSMPKSSNAQETTVSVSGTSKPQYEQHSPSFPHRGQPILPSPTVPTTATASTVNPFANLLSNADLVIEGNMDDMMQQWTDQEKQDHRRLVRLWRRQQGHEIICNFQAIPPTNRMNTSQEIIVSCIYWKNKNGYFITSVDIIYLLEALIGVRFTTEEKNRVRRNLEGFHPLTVSKFKPDSSDFFRLIMTFNHPKPRNIEKDLKVFEWPSLPTALKKIISKYSASYSSTASVTLDTHNT